MFYTLLYSSFDEETMFFECKFLITLISPCANNLQISIDPRVNQLELLEIINRGWCFGNRILSVDHVTLMGHLYHLELARTLSSLSIKNIDRKLLDENFFLIINHSSMFFRGAFLTP